MKVHNFTYSIASFLFFFASASQNGQCQTNVLTWHNDNGRTGANNQEKILNTSNVKPDMFGKLCSAGTDGQIYAQPLVVTGVPVISGISGVPSNHNVVYVATMKGSVYAFDADDCSLLRTVSLIPKVAGCTPGVTCEEPVDCRRYPGNGQCTAIDPTVGILSTPVIQTMSANTGTTGTMYVVAESQVGSDTKISAWRHRIHALDITDLSERPGSPALIHGSASGVNFASHRQIQRPGLLLLPGVGPNGDSMVYVAFSLMDGAIAGGLPHGWIFGYDTKNLDAQPAGLPYIFNTTPNGTGPTGPGGGVWQGGAGLAADIGSATDPTKYIYVGTGDGSFDANGGGKNYGDSFLKLTPDLATVAGYFTRFNEFTADSDTDYGSGGIMLVPNGALTAHPYIAVNGSKDRHLYVVDRGTPGGYNGVSNTNLQTIAEPAMIHNTPAYFDHHLYYAVIAGPMKSNVIQDTCHPGPICTPAAFVSSAHFLYGTTPSVSSNLTTRGTAIVWAIHSRNQALGGLPAVLYAFDAANLHQLYASDQCGQQDVARPGTKFSVPTVANGKVYVGTQTELEVYGELPSHRTCP
jgi:hypothetical protein